MPLGGVIFSHGIEAHFLGLQFRSDRADPRGAGEGAPGDPRSTFASNAPYPGPLGPVAFVHILFRPGT
jgi:hypothetical protein